jgi:hypothetical protein
MAEFTPPVAGNSIVRPDQSGTNPTTTAVSTLTATETAASQANDMAIMMAEVRYSVGTASTWTNPSGYTLIADNTAASNNAMYSAYNLSPGAGALAAAGTLSASTNVTSFNVIIVTFNQEGVPVISPSGADTAGSIVSIGQALATTDNW